MDVDNNYELFCRKAPIEGRGFGLLSNENVLSGASLLKCSNPYIAIPTSETLGSRCYECFQDEVSATIPRQIFDQQSSGQQGPRDIESNINHMLSFCTGCKVVKYCSRKCQTASWKRYHKLECKIFGEMRSQGKVLPTTTRALLLCMIQVKRAKSDLKVDVRLNDILVGGPDSFHDAEILGSWQDPGLRDDVNIQAAMACNLTAVNDDGLASRIMCKIMINSFQLSDYHQEKFGLLLDPQLALANHSCDPNAFISVDGRTATMRALRPIKKNEEICISYVDSATGIAERTKRIKKTCYFDCKCICCQDNKSASQMYEKALESHLQDDYLGSRLFPSSSLPDSGLNKPQWEAEMEMKPRPKFDQGLPSFCKELAGKLDDVSLKGSPALAANYPIADYLWMAYGKSFERFPVPTAYAALLFTHKVFHLNPLRYPSHVHPTRVSDLYTLASALPTVLDVSASRLNHLRDLVAIVNPLLVKLADDIVNHGLEIQAALLIVTRHYGIRCHGRNSRFVRMVNDDLQVIADSIAGMASQGWTVPPHIYIILDCARKDSNASSSDDLMAGEIVIETFMAQLRELAPLDTIRQCLVAVGNGVVQI